MLKLFGKKLKSNTFSFYDSDINHVKKVLRLKINDEILVTYDSNKYITKIISLEPLITEIKECIKVESKSFVLDLYQAIIKPKSFERIFSDASQLDVDNFYPVLFKRSQAQYNNELRLEKKAIANAKQANRIKPIRIHDFIKSNDLDTFLIKKEYDLIILPYENSEQDYLKLQDLNKSFAKIAIIIGPEGGFENNEIKNLSKLSNVKIIKLTNTILRSEAAALYTISIVSNYMLLLRS